MAGYGVPIVYGSVWGISSAVCWGFAAWKNWRKGGVNASDAGHGSDEVNQEPTKNGESRTKLLKG
jgi:hypothetical protein